MSQKRNASASFSSAEPPQKNRNTMLITGNRDSNCNGKYLFPIGYTDLALVDAPTLENEGCCIIPVRGLLRNLYLASDPGAATAARAMVVNVNGVDTALTASIGVGQHTAQDVTHTVQVQAGDRVSIGSPTSSESAIVQIYWAFELIPN